MVDRLEPESQQLPIRSKTSCGHAEVERDPDGPRADAPLVEAGGNERCDPILRPLPVVQRGVHWDSTGDVGTSNSRSHK